MLGDRRSNSLFAAAPAAAPGERRGVRPENSKTHTPRAEGDSVHRVWV